ncbi:MAG: fibronectin type III domain-containing protein [Alistipes sp.]|nr:fibronectin type III domain-containing protein [Alistipes sp.]
MKRFFSLMLVAVAAMAFVGCQNDTDDLNTTARKSIIEFTASFDETRSAFGDSYKDGDNTIYPSTWSGTETVYLKLNEAELVSAHIETAGATATFKAEIIDDKTETGNIYAFSPVGKYDKQKGIIVGGFTSLNAKYNDMYVVIPAEQYPSTTSVDETVHLLAATHSYSNGVPTAVNLTFKPVAAFGKMTITDFAEAIEKVEVIASEALAGDSCWYYYETGEFDNANEKTIAVINPADDNKTFWFGCAPADLSEGTLAVKVYAESGTYTKELNIAGKNFKFTSGRVSKFSVSMEGVEKDGTLPTVIEDGHYVIAGYVDGKYYALPNANKSTAGTIAHSEITVTDGKVATDDAVGYVWTIAAAEGGYTFYNGAEYLTATQVSGANLKTQAEAAVWALDTENTSKGYMFISPVADNRFLSCRMGTTKKFGAYAKTNYTGDEYYGVQLIPIDGVVKTTLDKPVLTTTVEGNSITVNWTAIEGAESYTVTLDEGTPETITETTKTFNGLEYSTQYTITVVANPEDEAVNTASTASTSATTAADPDAVATIKDGKYAIIAVNAAGDEYSAMTTAETSGSTARIASQVVTYDGEATTFTAPNNTYVWNIKSVDGGYVIYTNDNEYVNWQGGDTNGANLKGTADSKVTISQVEGTNQYNIQWAGNSSRYLAKNSSNAYFAFYKSGQRQDLFIVPVEVGVIEPQQLAAPTIHKPEVTSNSITVSWDDVANATGYAVSIDGGEATVVNTTNHTFNGLTPKTTYTISVVAKGDDTYYTDSNAATVEATTAEAPAASGAVYTKVTSAPADWSGTYLIVWDSGAHATISSKDLAKTADVTISNDQIQSNVDVDNAAVTIAKNGDYYSLMLPDGKYLSMNANGNQVNSVSSAYNLTLVYTDAGVKIMGKDTAGNDRILVKNGNYYRGYKVSNASSYILPTLYKKSGN